MEINKIMKILREREGTTLDKKMFKFFENQCKKYNSKEEILKGYEEGDFSYEEYNIEELTSYDNIKEIFEKHYEEILEEIEDYRLFDEKDLMERIDFTPRKFIWFIFEENSKRWINFIKNN